MTLNDNEFVNNNQGLDDMANIPFGDEQDEEPNYDDDVAVPAKSYFARNKNKLILIGITGILIFFVSGTSAAVKSRNNNVNANFSRRNPRDCKSTKEPTVTRAPKSTKEPKTTQPTVKKAPKSTKQPIACAPTVPTAPNKSKSPKSTKQPEPCKLPTC
mmetsp:Transcript_24038/g.39641  ORF Transcript_24038/g.39641 Transcript_24038/m.39641 type:complete len:158 (+) Transcript_24038:89-562(+)